MLILPPPRIHSLHRRPATPAAAPTPPPAALTLVAATFDSAAPYVELTFDRPVSLAGPLNLAHITVDDNVHTDNAFAGTGPATPVGPATVRVPLVVTGGAHGGSQTLLTAAADTGITAADDGGTWAGVTAVAVPFG